MAPSPNSTSPNFEGFRTIGSHIHLYEPAHTNPDTSDNRPQPHPSSTSDPTLIILCTWMGGATPRRITKYLSTHRTLFPGSAILLIRALVPENTFRGPSGLQARLVPARDAVVRIVAAARQSGREPAVLLHAMSNGGANSAVQLLRLLSRAEDGGAGSEKGQLPLKGLILDCAPSDSSLGSLLAVVRASVPASSMRPLFLAAVVPVLGIVPVLQGLGFRNPVDELRRDLNDGVLVPRGCRRLYLCGGCDEVVGAESVRVHSGEAEGVGYRVERVLFKQAEHCALLMREGKRYRRVVSEWWGGKAVRDGDWDRDRDKDESKVKAKL